MAGSLRQSQLRRKGSGRVPWGRRRLGGCVHMISRCMGGRSQVPFVTSFASATALEEAVNMMTAELQAKYVVVGGGMAAGYLARAFAQAGTSLAPRRPGVET